MGWSFLLLVFSSRQWRNLGLLFHSTCLFVPSRGRNHHYCNVVDFDCTHCKVAICGWLNSYAIVGVRIVTHLLTLNGTKSTVSVLDGDKWSVVKRTLVSIQACLVLLPPGVLKSSCPHFLISSNVFLFFSFPHVFCSSNDTSASRWLHYYRTIVVSFSNVDVYFCDHHHTRLVSFYTRTFLADRTATQYDRLLASSCCPSVCPSVCLWRCALWLSGSLYTAKSCTFRHFCYRMYRLATKCITKKQREKRHNCLWTQATRMHKSRTCTARLSTMTLSVPDVNCAAEVCGLRTRPLADADLQ